jgi:hypothetical protein
MRLSRYVRFCLVATAMLIATDSAVAQAVQDSIGPRPGTWGVEASYGAPLGASLLRFSSPRAAWMIGAFFSVGQETSDQLTSVGATTRNTNTLGSVELRVGRRWWTFDANERLRPFVGVGVGGRYYHYANARRTEGSVDGELGATYFFGPHVSIGAAGDLTLARGQDLYTNPGGPSSTTDRWYLNGNAARLNAAVYF